MLFRSIVIEPRDWVFAADKSVSKQPTSDGWTVKWEVAPMFVDEYTPLDVEDPSREYQTVLIQGLENTKHTLELVATGNQKPSIRAIRVYAPAFR